MGPCQPLSRHQLPQGHHLDLRSQELTAPESPEANIQDQDRFSLAGLPACTEAESDAETTSPARRFGHNGIAAPDHHYEILVDGGNALSWVTPWLQFGTACVKPVMP